MKLRVEFFTFIFIFKVQFVKVTILYSDFVENS